MAAFATYPQEPVFQATAAEVILKFPLNVGRQGLPLLLKVCLEGRAVMFHQGVEQRLFRLVALVFQGG